MSVASHHKVAMQMKERGPGVRGYPFVMALILSFAVFALAVILHAQ